MAQQKKTSTNTNAKQPLKKNEQKKHLIDPKYKNTFWTVLMIVVLTIFFIINNTKSVQERGHYPPNYTSAKGTISKQIIDSRVSIISAGKDTASQK
ncbi:MAG: hypothetical protein HXY50_16015 [Ignavibacteriaceae bacterium]|nr:hypothetical protein [Ignavibacteriaceae bacterium]